MAFINLNKSKLFENFKKIDSLFRQNNIEWTVVAKMLCGDREYLKVLVDMGVKEICDSRLSNLKVIKSICPDVQTVYIKPPAKRFAESIVAVADTSFNTEYETIKLLSDAAVRQNKKHKIVIMIELGELREGVMRDDLVDFYARVFELPMIEVVGIGTNLSCMNGVLPNSDKLIQLCLYKELIEAKFDKKIPYVSGGTSVTIPLIEKGLLPKGINHFRVGETLFLGTNVYDHSFFKTLHNNIFRLYAEIIELNEKPLLPDGEIGQNLVGETLSIDESLYGNTSYRAIVDVGLLDVEKEHIRPSEQYMHIAGASSDMFVVDLGNNPENLNVGDMIAFDLNYMGILRIMNSRYVDKRIDNHQVPEFII